MLPRLQPTCDFSQRVPLRRAGLWVETCLSFLSWRPPPRHRQHGGREASRRLPPRGAGHGGSQQSPYPSNLPSLLSPFKAGISVTLSGKQPPPALAAAPGSDASLPAWEPRQRPRTGPGQSTAGAVSGSGRPSGVTTSIFHRRRTGSDSLLETAWPREGELRGQTPLNLMIKILSISRPGRGRKVAVGG